MTFVVPDVIVITPVDELVQAHLARASIATDRDTRTQLFDGSASLPFLSNTISASCADLVHELEKILLHVDVVVRLLVLRTRKEGVKVR